MSNVLLYINHTAGAAINAYRIVKLSAASTVVLAAAATDSLMGVNGAVAPASGERCDVAKVGISYVEAGAAVSLGDLITADSVGRGITATATAGSNVSVIGRAQEAATAAGDLIKVTLSFGSMQG
jgi:hypothetical protein